MNEAGALYRQAILRLDEGKLERAQGLLERALAVRPKHARTQAALGHVYDVAGKERRALACLRLAHRLNPRDRIAEAYALLLLAELGPEKDAIQAIRTAARRHRVDLAGLRRQLAKAGFPSDARTLVANGFLHPRNFFRSWLADEAQRIRNRLEPGRAARLAAAARKECAQFQQALRRGFDRSRVPGELRPLAGWAARYGIGDDVCRPYLMQRLSAKQKGRLVREVDARAAAMQRWLDSFARGKMSQEAAAFMYLAEGVEEIRTIKKRKEAA